jgi:hypothetical protein
LAHPVVINTTTATIIAGSVLFVFTGQFFEL